ncbi:MAG TPA: sigma-54 dependent transcriptional regulator [Tepidisphaeraceae bacterium]|jgi:NtrC-family two-component system response regulator AlgB|nr:sigma-54 dependent transcriptional regulator [Tepidisphaeraceae bacterium]
MSETRLELRALRILVIDDEEHIRFALSMCLETDGHKVVVVGTIEAALEETARQAFDLIFLDVRLGTRNGLDYIQSLLEENPWARIIVITAYASIDTAVEAMKRGASDYLSKPFEPAQLTLLTRKVAERRLLERKVEALQKTLGSMDPEADFPASSPIWRESIEFARRVATANSPVLIRGEAGTGKGRLASAIHDWSTRAAGPFASISFAGQSIDALEVELFGSGPEIGGKIGAIAFCHGGTLLIDEIGGMPMRLQPKLLTVIRDREFEKQDQFIRRPADVRIIATTSVDLQPAVEAGKFRGDLMMAISVAQVDIPALRERSEDTLLLAERYLAYFIREHPKAIAGFDRDASFVLKKHSWPGNARELRNVVERAVLACDGELIGLDHLPPDLMNTAFKGTAAANGGYKIGDLVPLEVIEEAHIQQVLASVKTIRRAAAVLGLNASALCRRLKRAKTEGQHDELAQ